MSNTDKKYQLQLKARIRSLALDTARSFIESALVGGRTTLETAVVEYFAVSDKLTEGLIKEQEALQVQENELNARPVAASTKPD
jgi:hypothetical protein